MQIVEGLATVQGLAGCYLELHAKDPGVEIDGCLRVVATQRHVVTTSDLDDGLGGVHVGHLLDKVGNAVAPLP